MNSSASASSSSQARGFKLLLRALRSRNYRLFFGGQGVSLIGTWMTRTATLWLVYDLTKSKMMLGVVGFAGQIPIFLLAALAGVFIDRHQRRRLLVITQILSMLQSFMLAWLALSGQIQLWHIILLSVFQGVVNACDMPCRQAFLLEMIENPADLPNAIALNSSMFNGARLVGPALAGVVIAQAGAGYCFLADGLSYLAVIASLLAMRVKPRKIEAQRREVWHELREGFAYTFGFTPLRAVLLMLTMVSMMGMFYVVLMPVFATETLRGDSRTYGILMAAPGLGALAGALFLASRPSVRGLGRVIVWAGCLFGAAQVAFAYSSLLWLSLPLLLLAGLGMMVQIASSNTILQTISAEEKRGRVMSFYTMALVGAAPFGSLLAGALAQWLGAPAAVRVGGCCCILSALLFLRKLPEIRALIRPIYVEKGIIEEH